MGCFPSKRLLGHRDQLDSVEAICGGLTAAFPGDSELAKARGLAEDYKTLCTFFFDERQRQDGPEVERLRKLLRRLIAILTTWMDARIIKAEDFDRAEALVDIANALGAASREPAAASAGVETKYKTLMAARASDIIAVHNRTANVSAPERVPDVLRATVQLLKELQPFFDEIPSRISEVLGRNRDLATSVVASHERLLQLNPGGAIAAVESARSFDGLCGLMAVRVGESWAPIEAELRNIQVEHSAKVIPEKIKAAELELDKSAGMNRKALAATLSEIDVLWVTGDEDLEARVQGIAGKIERRVLDAYQKALAAGASSRLDQLLEFASEYDASCVNLRRLGTLDARVQPLARRLEALAAGVTIQTLLVSAKNNIAENAEALRSACRDAEAKVKAVPRDRYDVREDAKWLYKVGGRSGKSSSLREFDAEATAAVEAKYQKWVAAGRPKGEAERRCELKIEVVVEASPASGATSPRGGKPAPGAPSALRPRCKFGAKCFRKKPEHRREFAHPGDSDYSDSLPTTCSPVSDEGRARVHETYSLDFHLMTQVNLDRSGKRMRNIKRAEGQTVVQKLTGGYFESVKEFVKGVETMVSQAERELRLLGDAEADQVRGEIADLLQALRPSVQDYLSLSVLVRDSQAIDEIVARLGSHSDELGIADLLKELRCGDVAEELRQAYLPWTAPTHQRWGLVRMLVSNRILTARLSKVKGVDEYWTLRRRQVQMRCQALLSEYEEDASFCARFSGEAESILLDYLKGQAEYTGHFQAAVVQGILRTAVTLGCDMAGLVATAMDLARAGAESACRAQLQPLARVTELLEAAQKTAAIGQRKDAPNCLVEAAPLLAERTVAEVTGGPAGGGRVRPESLTDVVRLRGKLNAEVATAFDEAFWGRLQPWYAELGEGQSAMVEWAIAYCEQLKMELPPWMMSKDQVEALRRLQDALKAGDEAALREAVIFARQADCKADERLAKVYDDSVNELRKLKRLPSGWEVTDLLKDDAKEKMFMKANLEDPTLLGLFQKLFDETKVLVTTRDRVGAVPRGYKVQRIVSVMNAESWGSYLKRRDEISDQCRLFEGAAPCPDAVWDSWSGKVATDSPSCQELLARSKYPPLAPGANEFLMFHGTKPEAADSIAENHFDMAFACKTGFFGAGLYFAEACSKSDEYVKPDSRDHFPLILARVTLGRVNYCDAVDPITIPGRKALESSCIGGGYHSVLGDRKKVRGTYREFIVYDHYQVYPHFIVWYTRL